MIGEREQGNGGQPEGIYLADEFLMHVILFCSEPQESRCVLDKDAKNGPKQQNCL